MAGPPGGGFDAMRILYVNTPVYDYLTAAIIEGLNLMAGEGAVEVVTTARSNYARRSQTWSRSRVNRGREKFDCCILGTNVGVDEALFWDVVRPGRAVCIDGADESAFAHDPSRFALYFKRELLNPAPAHVLPCPLAVERRWLQPIEHNTRYVFSACFGPRQGERASTLGFLKGLRFSGEAYIGPVASSFLHRLHGVWQGQCTWRVSRRNPFGVGHNRSYYDVLRSSLASLSVRGLGVDTARWWEILGAGALLLSPSYSLPMPHPLTPGEHYLTYVDHQDLLEKIHRVQNERQTAERMRERARAHCLGHHTTRARAAYVIDMIKRSL
jgi:hypothetical protein